MVFGLRPISRQSVDIRVSPRFLRTHTLRKFADEKKHAVEAYIEETVIRTKKKLKTETLEKGVVPALLHPGATW
jgi:hypothetical protein